jgi:GPH family glycoside/pentoside/hexuronide:cation symporter
VKYSLGGNDAITSILLGMAFIVAGFALWPWRRFVADRWGARTTLLAAYAVVGIGAGLLYVAPAGVWVYLVTALVGVGLSGMILMGDVIVADVIDEDEARTGERRAGAYYGLSGLITTLSGTVTAIAFGVVATVYGYDPKLAAQPDSVATGFRVFMSAVPALASAVAIGLLVLYPLHGQRLARMRADLAERRAAIPR